MPAPSNADKPNGSAKRDQGGREPLFEAERAAAKFALTAIGAFGTLAGFITFLAAQGLRHWVSVHSYLTFLAFVVTALAALVMANHIRVLTARYRKLDAEARSREVASQAPDDVKEPALALLDLLSAFGPAPVSEDMLLRSRNVPAATPALHRVLTDAETLRLAAEALSRMSLADIDRANKQIQLRRIAQEVARGQLSTTNPRAARDIQRMAQSILAANDPGTPDRDDTADAYQQSRRHLTSSGATESADPRVRQHIINQIRRFYREGRYAEGIAVGESALVSWREIFSPNDRQTLALAVEVATAMRRLGRWREAMELNQNTLERLRAHPGNGGQSHLICARNCGIDLALRGEYTTALDNDLRLLPSYDQLFGPGHLETLQLHHEIAIHLRCLGRYGEALGYDQRTFAQRQQILGGEDAGTLNSQLSIARDLRLLGRAGEAHSILADIRSTLAGKQAASRQLRLLVDADMAVSLRRCGRYQEALVQAEETFREYNDTYGAEYRDTLRVAISLVSDLRISGRLLEARSLGRRTVDGWASTGGASHPNTLAAQATLASVLRAQGELSGALRLDEQTFSAFDGMFGGTHPSTLVVLTNMASDMAMLGDVHGARQAGERSLRAHTEAYGPDHPFTLATAANLSLDRRADGDHHGADQLHASALRAADRILGTMHPDVRTIARYERITLDIEPMMD
jgi:tetratricopeptide (TPR) repeat protein